MAKILAISSQVVYGPVGNTAAVPALQALGHEVMQVPTVLLSHHPGHGKPEGLATPPDLLERLLTSAGNAGAFDQCDAVITGYFANAEQVEIVALFLPQIGAQTVMVDPVIGDHGALYVAEEIAEAIRDRLLPQARIITPNLFELGWLTSTEPETAEGILAAANMLGRELTLVTSVAPEAANAIASVLISGNDLTWSTAPRQHNVPHGTGDFLAGLFLGHFLKGSTEYALAKAMHALNHAIAISAGQKVLKIEEALKSLPPFEQTWPD
jgi:pyridoxine kinase